MTFPEAVVWAVAVVVVVAMICVATVKVTRIRNRNYVN